MAARNLRWRLNLCYETKNQQHIMKTLRHIGPLLLVQAAVAGVPVYQNDFSSTILPLSNWEIGGRQGSGFGINVNSSLESETGNQYARLDVTTTGTVPNAGWSWYGGWYDTFGGLTNFPNQFRFSFDVSHAVVEPIRVTLTADRRASPYSLAFELRTYWVQPASTNWQHITIDQNSPYSVAYGDWGTSQSPLFWMEVVLASRDDRGNPLSIATDGTHSFFLDNAVFEVVPEPNTLTFATVAVTGAILSRLFRHRRLQWSFDGD